MASGADRCASSIIVRSSPSSGRPVAAPGAAYPVGPWPGWVPQGCCGGGWPPGVPGKVWSVGWPGQGCCGPGGGGGWVIWSHSLGESRNRDEVDQLFDAGEQRGFQVAV